MPSTSAPATHSQPSRKGKKAWRKNVDIGEVQQGLEAVREEIIRTGGVIAEKAAEELFATDIAGDAEVEAQQKLQRGKVNKKLLKADEILAQRSAVLGLNGRLKRKVDESESAIIPGMYTKKQRNGSYVSHKDLQRLRRVADNDRLAIDLHEVSVATHDPWATATPSSSLNAHEQEYSFLEPVRPKMAPKTLSQAPTPLTANGKPIPHVKKPQGEKSYNPRAGDYADLLEREGVAAIHAEQARLDAEAADADRQLRAEAEAVRVEAFEKDREGYSDYATDYESEWEGIASEAEQEVFSTKPQRRKTPAERNKIKARKEREARAVWERKQKARDEQEKQIKQIAREVSARDKARRPGTITATSIVNRDEEDSSDASTGQEEQLQRRRFGKLPIPDAPLEVTLPEDLQDSLRRLKPEGNLLTDRYRNLLINGKLEVRKKVGQVKKKQTFGREKWSYKDWELK